MNILFLLLAASLVLIGLFIIIPPLWRTRPLISLDINARNASIAKQQQQELKAQLQAGTLSLNDYEAQLAELELVLSDNLETNSLKPADNHYRAIVYLLIIIIPLLATVLYASLGNFQAIEPTPAMLGANNPDNPSLADIEKMVAKLADHTKAEPNDSKAWLMLGKSYKYLQRYPQAADAFAHAYTLLGQQAEVMLLYADALAFAQGEQLAGKPAELIFKALELEPNNIQALWLGGMVKAQAGDAVQALSLWHQLEKLLPDNSPEKQETQQLLAKLESQLPENLKTPTKTANSNAAITVQVSIADDLKTSINPDDIVFIYAQASAQQKMPLAIVRKQIKDLPVTVTLDDSLAMMPTMKVSAFDKVIISARVSKSGQAMAQSGDLIGTLDAIAVVDKNTHNLVINNRVP
ncbi:MAG: c-type cytochrome biogenesis protein CcmI [Methylococcaceae bacterium]